MLYFYANDRLCTWTKSYPITFFQPWTNTTHRIDLVEGFHRYHGLQLRNFQPIMWVQDPGLVALFVKPNSVEDYCLLPGYLDGSPYLMAIVHDDHLDTIPRGELNGFARLAESVEELGMPPRAEIVITYRTGLQSHKMSAELDVEAQMLLPYLCEFVSNVRLPILFVTLSGRHRLCWISVQHDEHAQAWELIGILTRHSAF